ncbi:hypothetical protein [Teredinibacter purpureus]|uniref:hypothetical protein n=1 Tax=Teredinibacter purpureus TaxID=2731756 RepID=UPI0005F80849|nr:hypothetical protein [Teredinibacter purpureus]
MKPAEDEHRGLKRAPVHQVILVRDVLHDVEVGRVVNLHEEGFMILGGDEVKENCLYQLQFTLSSEIDGVTCMNIGAECLWIRETVGDTRNWAGFHIVDIAGPDVDIISKLKNQIDD